MKSRDTIVLRRDVERGEEISSSMGSVIVYGNILDGANVSARDDVTAYNVGDNVRISSTMGSVKVQHVGNNCAIQGRDDVSALNISNNVKITSSMGAIVVKDVGNHCTLSGRDGVETSNILGAGNTIQSSQGSIKAGNIGNSNHLNGRDEVTARNLANNVQISSSMGSVNVQQVGNNCTLSGRDDVEISNILGAGNTIQSSQGSLRAGNIGNSNHLNGRDGIKVEDVGEGSHLTSTLGEIIAEAVGANSTLNGRDGVTVRGECHFTASLNSSLGNVTSSRVPSNARTVPRNYQPQNNLISNNNVTSLGSISVLSRGNGTVIVNNDGVSTTYRGYNTTIRNNNVITDDIRVTENDSRTVSRLQPSVNLSSNSNSLFSISVPPIQSTSGFNSRRVTDQRTVISTPRSNSLSDKEKELEGYSKHLREYVLNFEGKEKLSDKIKGLELTSDEEKLFTEFEDPITFEYMDIPVSLNENIYNFKTLCSLTADPLTREEFTKPEIQSARNVVNRIEGLITQVKNDRELKTKGNSTGSNKNNFFQASPQSPGENKQTTTATLK